MAKKSRGVLVKAEADLPEASTRWFYLTFVRDGQRLAKGQLREGKSADDAIAHARRWESEVAGVVAYAVVSEARMDGDALVEPDILYRAGRLPPELADA